MIGISDTSLSENEIEAAVRVLRSGALRQGKECEAFEKEFAEHVGVAHAVTCANGSAALHLAYFALLSPGDEILVPAFTFIATASMAEVMGARPVFCDVDPDTFLIDLGDAERRITKRTRAIAPVHLFGNPVGLEAVSDFANAHGLEIVWDAAQSHGAEYAGRDIGGFKGVTCYSFYPSKNMFVGEGGMICTDDAECARQVRFLRTHGQTGKYYHTSLGFNYRMTDVEAAIGREQLKRLDDMLAVRRSNAARLSAYVEKLNGLSVQQVTTGGRHAWHQFCVLVDAERFGCDRDEFSSRLQDAGIQTGVHYPRGLHQQPIFEQIYGTQSLPVTERLAQRILALPIHHGLRASDVDAIGDALSRAARQS